MKMLQYLNDIDFQLMKEQQRLWNIILYISLLLIHTIEE